MLNACIVGLGSISGNHANAIIKSGLGRIYAVCDCMKERADKAAELYHAKAVYDYSEVLSDESIDVVHICTPHYLHADMAIKALQAGKHIVLEKPLAIHFEELERLEKAYQASDKKACIMFQNRTNRCSVAMKKLIEEDKSLGKMLGISGFLLWCRDSEYYNSEPWRGTKAYEGGGVLINQAIHTLDLINWMSGGIKAVKCSMSNKWGEVSEVEDTVDALFEMNNGCRGVFYATNAFCTDISVKIEAVFENATLRYCDSQLFRIEKETTLIETNFTEVCGKRCWGSGHQPVIRDFYDAVLHNTDNYIDLTSGLHTARVVLSMYQNDMDVQSEWKTV